MFAYLLLGNGTAIVSTAFETTETIVYKIKNAPKLFRNLLIDPPLLHD